MNAPLTETVTLSQAKAMISCLALEQSVLLLSPPGVGKSDIVREAAAEANLPCKSLLGTQIAPEDVSGVPRIIGERSVFCPPRVLLPENSGPFCLFLDELPACSPDVQKAFYSLLLERRVGEFPLPPGTWVVAAGNRAEDRALVRTISSALINRVLVLQVRIDVEEWLTWSQGNGVRHDVTEFIRENPDSLLREVPSQAVPFSTPRAWASLSRAMDLAERAGILNETIANALARGRVSESDATSYILQRGKYRTQSVRREAALVMSLVDLNLSVRATNCLEAENITTVGELLLRSESDLLTIRNFSPVTLREVKQRLAEIGLVLGMPLGGSS